MRRRRSAIFSLGASALLVIGATGSVFAGNGYGGHGGRGGALYTLSNQAAGNAVIGYEREADGSLTHLGTYPTGGLGGGGGLGSQGAVVLSENGRLLLAVDAGSDQITSFRVDRDGSLTRADRIGSGGDHPISVTIDHRLVYVVNDGGDGNIAGFRIDRQGDLHRIPGSRRALSGPGTGPAQIEFTPSGNALVVTEKNTNQVLSYRVRRDGRTTGPSIIASAGVTPFGFAFDRFGRAIVSEATGGMAGASTVSSYRVSHGGSLSVVDGPLATGQGAACWAATTPDGRFAYIANTGSDTVTGVAIYRDGRLDLIDDGATGTTGAGPTDLGTSADGEFLYVLNGGGDSLSAFRIHHDGSLDALPGVDGLPAPGVGLAVR
jgi:6-phosphogluconolactonase